MNARSPDDFMECTRPHNRSPVATSPTAQVKMENMGNMGNMGAAKIEFGRFSTTSNLESRHFFHESQDFTRNSALNLRLVWREIPTDLSAAQFCRAAMPVDLLSVPACDRMSVVRFFASLLH